MSNYESLSHSKWDCTYHVVFIPKGRKRELYGKIRTILGPVFRELASQRSSKIEKGSMVQDHVHMMIRIPPKYSVAEVVGYIKGKSAIAVARQFSEGKRIPMVSGFGPEDMPSLQWDSRKLKFENTLKTRNSWTARAKTRTVNSKSRF